ncbi:MAG TPA: 3-phosphoshikimate 1-carboxyvinyltransferase [Methylomirabilota bacterium]|nr:3-phosphoshikimate 1-carboxyvinyltransferase [Methylomirabilota bacterium]
MRFRVRPVTRLEGTAQVPGDKSISHRAALLGALADGATEVHGYLEAEDCLRTIAAVQALGADVTRKGPGHYRIVGAGLHGLQEPGDVVDCGNSGTSARLLLGVLAGQPFWTMLTGDESLRRRPMGRVAEPLARMGATLVGRKDATRLPLAIKGLRRLRALAYVSPVASAQVKSAILLAGLYADGPVSVTEPARSRDHSERMLRRFGARLSVEGTTVTLTPGELAATTVHVPGDVSSAAFLLVAGAIVGAGRVTVAGVGVNPTRTGVLDVLEAMGARLEGARGAAGDEGEPAASLTVGASPLRATAIGGALVPRLIDEVPALAVAAAVARGVTTITDAAELRVKESDRIAMLARELGKMGVRVEERPDGMAIAGPQRFRGARVSSGGDHRMAMALAVAGLVADGETLVDDTACVATSFPQFAETLNALAGTQAVVAEDE